MKDKANTLEKVLTLDRVDVELGCGIQKRNSKAIGIDLLDSPVVDIIGEALEVLREFPECSVDSICSHHFFEHVETPDELLTQIRHVLKPGGKCEFVVPHFSNSYFDSGPTHKQCFGLYTFAYYADCNFLRRTVPTYSRIEGLRFTRIQLAFLSWRPNYARHAGKRCFEKIVNLSSWTQECCEELFCWYLTLPPYPLHTPKRIPWLLLKETALSEHQTALTDRSSLEKESS